MELNKIITELETKHDYIGIGSHFAMCFSDYRSIEDVPNEEFGALLEEYLYSLELGDYIERDFDSSYLYEKDDFGFE